MVPDAFYMVWRNGGYAPTKKHETIESAREESRRLAKQEPQVEYFILRVIEGVMYNENPYRVRNFKKQKETPTTSAARYAYPLHPPLDMTEL